MRSEGDHYVADDCIIPLGASVGWEAALFDHYQALVTAIVHKLTLGKRRSGAQDEIGGSTYHFDLYAGHPLEGEVRGFLASVRRTASELRSRVEEHAPPADAQRYRTTFYAGQNVLADEPFPSGLDAETPEQATPNE